MKFGLRNIRYLLQSVGKPEEQFPSIHIAGTNGKGSTAAFLASITMEAGYRTALYTSPHLVRFTERIRIDGREISEKRLVAYVRALRPVIEKVHATFFEATTCIAFQYFADQGVDVAVIEAGLGGRLDSTNVVTPMVSVITNIGLEHTEILGKTIASISREKAGIIKRGVPCVTSSEDASALGTFRRIATLKNSKLYQARRVVRCGLKGQEPETVSFRSRSFSIPDVNVGFSGPYQIRNAQLALATLEAIRQRRDQQPFVGRINSATVRRGLEKVAKNTGLRGRLEISGRFRGYILDVAHNSPGIRVLVEALRARGYGNLPVVFGVMKDKDYPAMVDELATISSTIFAVAPAVERALNARTLHGYIRRQKIPVCYGGTVAEGLKMAKKLARPVLVTGSHYVVGEALTFLNGKKA
jgi:dihydrofolate synthase / folylpolyglutamate synthase